MNEEIAATVISHCRLAHLESTLKRWDRLSPMQLRWLFDNRPTKAIVRRRLCTLISQNELTQEISGDLELVNVQLNSRRKMWKVYRLKGKDLLLNLDPRSLQNRVVKEIKLSWNDGEVHANMNMYVGAVWLRIHFDNSHARRKKINKQSPKPRVYNHNQSVFLVVFQNSPYVFVSRTRVTLSNIVSEVLKSVLGADSMTLQLSGRHVASLADIIHTQHMKGSASTYRDQEIAENPLCPGRKRKTSESEEMESIEGVTDENRQEKRMRMESFKTNFGTSTQPELETISYRFDTVFCGRFSSDFKCRSSVEIKGKSVLEGLRQATKSGLIRCPLPKHIAAITSRARNSFVIENTTRGEH